MNKSTLLGLLASDFYYVGPPVLQGTIGQITRYTVPVYDAVDSGATLVLHNEDFLVRLDGDPSEEAFWSVRRPKPEATARTFVDDAKAYLQSKVTDGTLVAAFVESFDDATERASARVFILATGVVSEKLALLYRQAGVVTHRVVDTPMV